MKSKTNPTGENEKTIQDLRSDFTDFVHVKVDEVREARTSWRYYHSVQYSKDELDALYKRKQPAIVFDRTSRKIDGLVGTVMRLRADPKAYPRTPAHEAGAELATCVLRYCLDSSKWIDVEQKSVLSAAVHGIAVCEIGIEPGDNDDPDIIVTAVDSTTFFYDPRSLAHDFSDARFMGVHRWVSEDEIEEMFPGKSEELPLFGSDYEGTDFDADKDQLWVNSKKKLRLVEHWYRSGGMWKWCIHIGTAIIDKGDSPFVDERGQSICRYIPFRNNVDQDGDAYGFVRKLKGPQDAMNQHRSKAIHIMNTRQIYARRGAFADIEKARREMMRPDGVIEFDMSKDDFSVEQPSQEFLQQTKYFEDARLEIENFGPNPALIGTGVDAKSGRALALMQQSGLAELGPFLGHYRAWKLRVYRALWNACRTHWKGERLIRVTDDEGLAQFVKLNALEIGPDFVPFIMNQLGALEVDIILDEGPDTTNAMGDTFDVLSTLAQSKFPVPPQAIIEVSSLPKSQKEKVLKLLAGPQADPEQVAAQQQAEAMAIAQAEQAKQQSQLQYKQAENQITLASKAQEAELSLRVAEQQAQLDLIKKQAEIELQANAKAAEQALAMQAAADDKEDSAEGETETEDSGEEDAPNNMAVLASLLEQNQQVTLMATQAMANAIAMASAPKRVIRGPDGRVEGVETIQ